MASSNPHAQRDPLIGRVINDRFEIIAHIATGGMGSVYRAKQRPLGRDIALKVLSPSTGQNEAAQEDFQRRFFLEAATVAKLSHPNTVTVFDYGIAEEGMYFIAMELVEGITLASLMRHEGVLDAGRAAHIAMQIARSLREAHGLGVIHRDLKPANVLVSRAGAQGSGDEGDVVKVLDFGLVKEMDGDDELTQAGIFMGSPKYMAPEQIEGRDVDARTDIYALGITLYKMLCGRVPFQGSSQMATLIGHVRESVPPMSRRDGVPIPDALAAVVMRCLAKRADQRFSSMQEVIEAIKVACAQARQQQQISGSFPLGGTASGSWALTPVGGLPLSASNPALTPPGGLAHSGERLIVGSAPPRPPSSPGAGSRSKRVGLFATLTLAAIAAAGAFAMDGFRTTPTVPATGAEGAAPATPAGTAADDGSSTIAAAHGPTDARAFGEYEDPGGSTASTAATAAPSRDVASLVVDIRSSPAGAAVVINGRERGVTPMSLQLLGGEAEVGAVLRIELTKRGFAPYAIMRVVTGEPLQVMRELQAAPRVVRRRRSPANTGSDEGRTMVTRPREPPSREDRLLLGDDYRPPPY